jgi:NAD-dependent SIR2 family protein deacetylase
MVNRKEIIDYTAEHHRVYRKHGSAKDYECFDCLSVAQDWSHIHGTDRRNPDNYNPRCRKCHAIYDAKHGDGHARSKLDSQDVLEMREMYSTGRFSYPDLAYIFNTSATNVGNIIRRRAWTHI